MKLALFLPDGNCLNEVEKKRFSSLVGAYESQVSLKLTKFTFPEELSLNQIDELAKTVNKGGFDALVFISSKPHPAAFLRRFTDLGFRNDLIFHVDGNFTQDVLAWESLTAVLKMNKVKFITISQRHLLFVQSLFQNEKNVSYIPPSLDSSVVNNNYEPGELLRKQRGIKNNEWIFLYNGDLSRQKHIIELTSIFGRFISEINPNAQLWLNGKFDDQGIPYVGKSELSFEHFQQWQQVKNESAASDKIHYLGNLSGNELKPFLMAADWGVFPSTCNNEDFDFAALEALFSGLPCLLSDWGGNADLAHIKDTRLVPVKMENFHLSPDFTRLTKEIFLITTATKRPTVQEKTQRAQRIEKEFSLAKSSEQLLVELKLLSPFEGFTANMQKIARAYKRNAYAPFVDVSSFGGYNSEFEELYAPYFGRS